MERNWLIRTSQNQILGPVAKQKLLEFIEKGALGLNDEVASGNGYWFALREKELVEKYIYGDIPQGYNPISESKSVLSKRENPERTTSINTAPANKTQTFKPAADGPVTLPKADDLEFPDITLIRTSSSQVENTEVTKLPNPDDLEFPDITLITRSPAPQYGSGNGLESHSSSSAVMTPVKNAVPETFTSTEDVVYPKDEDLDFPDIDSVKATISGEAKEHTSEFEFSVNTSPSHTQTVAVKASDVPAAVTKKAAPARELENENDLGELTLTIAIPDHKKETKETPHKEVPLSLKKRETPEHKAPREEKLLHDRKVKTATKTPVRENREVVSIENSPEPLKKRNDNYIFFILIILALILLAVFFYFREILNKPLPV